MRCSIKKTKKKGQKMLKNISGISYVIIIIPKNTHLSFNEQNIILRLAYAKSVVRNVHKGSYKLLLI